MVDYSFTRQEQLYAMMGKRADSLKELGPPDDWELLESIGEGTYGAVYKVKNKTTGEIAAVKVIDSIHEKIEEIVPELEILKKYADHPNIAEFNGAFVNKGTRRNDQLWLVMELCRGGSVTNLVRSLRKKGKYLDEDVIAYILYETLQGIEHLHRHNVMHRDIKGPNVMLTSEAEIRLIDFGVSAEVSNILMRRNSSVGTPFWMAPEVIACEQQLDYSYDVRCDIWSLGITAIELADGVTPLSDQHPMRALFKIPRSKPPSMKNPERWSHQYRDFIAKCLMKDFEERPHTRELLKHVFVSWVEGKRETLRQRLMRVMDSQYQGGDGIMDEASNEKQDQQLSLKEAGFSSQPPRKKKNLQDNGHQMLFVDNLAELDSLSEDIILSHLLERYLNNQIYTYIGDILIAINPLQTLNVYGKKHSNMYKNSPKSALPPHIFMVADVAHQAMVHHKNPQCCLISGESGAGKTVSANYLVQHLAELGKAGNRTLEEKILQVNPLMEALGNAQTVINDNSSRFGKYLELHFTSNGALTGGILSEYLLEKSRVVSQSPRERNFHIFYYMIAGLAYHKKLEKYSFKLYSQHNYLQTGGRNLQDIICTLGNRRKFEEVQRSFDIIGFSHEKVSWLFSILAAVIHLGDIQFTEDESVSHLSDKSMVCNPQVLLIVSSLLGINAVELRDALTTNSNVTRGETIVRNNSVEQAVDYRDGMAKALYGKLFGWTVHRINSLLRTDRGRPVSNDYRIGILDIFGFENFKRNSFEQLCINIANEQIQFYFNQQIFSWELEEYRSEGIAFEEINFTDNRSVLDMFLQKPIGLLALLDEESRFPKASDFTLVDKFHKNLAGDYYQKAKDNTVYPSFVIIHYAGQVTYDATNFLEKNRDTLSPDIIHALRSSENRLVRTIMQHPLSSSDSVCYRPNDGSMDGPYWWRVNKPPQGLQDSSLDFKPKESWLKGLLRKRRTHGFSVKKHVSQPPVMQNEKDKVRGDQRKRMTGMLSLTKTKQTSNSTSKWQQTVSMHFRYSLRDLLSKLLPTESHFVRCIRPNEQMIPNKFDQDKVQTQLKYTGVLETTRIRRQGYSERVTFQEFVKRYQVIAFPLHKSVGSYAASCREILLKTKLKNWLLGRNKVFLKYYHVEELTRLLEIHRTSAIHLQRVARGWMVRKRFAKLKLEKNQAASVIQKHARGYLARRRYLQEYKPKLAAAVVIQSAFRRLVQRRRFTWWLKCYYIQQRQRARNATKIQAVVRGYLVRKRFLRLRDKRHRGATTIQAVYRGYKQRRNAARIKEKVEKMGTKTIYVLQQSSMKVPRTVVLPEKDLTRKVRQHVPHAPGTIIHESARANGSHTVVRPKTIVLVEAQGRNPPRTNRMHRKEIWSADDETYFNSFMNDRSKRDSRDQGRRIREMLSIVRGGSTDNGEVNTVLQKQSSTAREASLVTKARTFFENQEKPLESKPVVSRKRSTIGKPALEAPITRFKPEKPVARPANVQRKIKEPQNQAYQVLTKQDVLVKSKAEPPPSRNMSSIPPPDYRLPPEKPGHPRHVTPEPMRVTRKNFQARGIHQRHNSRSNAAQANQPFYSHLLRKTGRRGELGIEDNEDSDVTCISFNVPLIGVS